MAVEFMPWYGTAEQMVRCAGDDGCGSLLMSGDTELHQQWHDKVYPTTTVVLSSGTFHPAATEPAAVAERVLATFRQDPLRGPLR